MNNDKYEQTFSELLNLFLQFCGVIAFITLVELKLINTNILFICAIFCIGVIVIPVTEKIYDQYKNKQQKL